MSLNIQRTGEGQAMILMHGLFGMQANLNQLARHFSQRYTVHNIDLPGHGGSSQCEFKDIPSMAQWIVEYIDQQQLDSCLLLGHSLGGKVAMQVAQARAENISALIVADIAPLAHPPHHREIIDQLKRINLATLKSRAEANEQLATVVDESGVRQFLLKSLYTTGADQWAWRFNLARLDACYAQLCLSPSLAQSSYAGPTLFLRGARSDYLNSAAQQAVTKHYPQAQIHTLEDAGHWLHVEKAAEFIASIDTFIAEVKA